ncbi:MAG: alpha/beta fold hydrolase [Myxococcales bacterium]|nr:alpha/beta fold hydrolase [Myxococcales bacterium]
MRRWLGLKNLVIDGVERTTNLVQETHESAARRAYALVKLVEPLEEPAAIVEELHGLTARTVFASIRLTNRAVGAMLEGGHRLLAILSPERRDAGTVLKDDGPPMRSDALGTAAWFRDAALGAVNGVVGDYLAEQGNPLGLEMTFRRHGAHLPLDRESLAEALPDATGKLCVFVHGLACTEWTWSAFAAETHGDPAVNYGTLLARDHGFTPIYLRYNSGLHISENGRRLAELLEVLCAEYPVAVEELVLIGHSMGGLVIRSASHYGSEAGRAWVKKLSDVVCIAAPHFGAPLEKAGHLLTTVLKLFDTPGTQIPARIIDARSVGIKDLRHGYVLDDDWLEETRNEVPFIPQVRYSFVAATVTADPNHPLAHLAGDLLVRLASATGAHPEPAERIPFELGQGAVLGGLTHVQLANHPAVYAQICRLLRRTPQLPTPLTFAHHRSLPLHDS